MKKQEMQIANCKLQIANWGGANVGEFLRNSHPRFGETRLHGLTLIELLVVIIILTTIVAAAIPILAPADSDREVREATRGANTYLTGAQTRAALNRRPFGVALKRLSQDTLRPEDRGVSLEMYYVEQQPPYAGFDPNSRVCVGINRQLGLTFVRFVTRGNDQTPDQDWLPIGWDADLFPGDTIQPGDVIEIGDTRYELRANIQDAIRSTKGQAYYYPPNYGKRRAAVEITVVPINDTGQLINVEYDDRGRLLHDGEQPGGPLRSPYWTAPMPYKILRQPIATSDPPYQLPEGTAIDLRASGIGSKVNPRFFHYPVNGDANSVDNDAPVYIMFTPEGSVSQLVFSELPCQSTACSPNEPQKFDDSVVDNVYLLLGKRENIPAPAAGSDVTLSSTWTALTTDEQRMEKKEPINWLLGQSRWIVIGSQSGRVVSIENASVDPLAVINDPNPPFPATQASEPMRTRQILAAREFTYEMANVGGR